MSLASTLSFSSGPLYLLASTFIFKDYIGATERVIAGIDVSEISHIYMYIDMRYIHIYIYITIYIYMYIYK